MTNKQTFDLVDMTVSPTLKHIFIMIMLKFLFQKLYFWGMSLGLILRSD